MKKGLKITTIGGGSSYTPELIEGFIKRYEELPVSEIWLFDIPEGEEKLKIVGSLAKRMVQKSGYPIEIYLTLDRKEALKDADFVTTQFRVGLLDARENDERIPMEHGVIGQETNGPGGLFKGLRTIPVILEICQDMEEVCPEAWLINFTNPTGMITEAVLRYSNIDKAVGLCNVPIGIQMNVAKLMNVEGEPNRIHIDFAGLNHMVFGLNVYLDGVKITEKVIEKLSYPENSMKIENIEKFEWVPEFAKALKVLPCPYHLYYFKTDEMLNSELEDYKEKGTRAEVVKELENDLFQLYQDENIDVKPPQLEQRGGAYYSDAACRLINSIYNDKRDIQAVNTHNKGSIPSISYKSAVEISSVITKDGPVPLALGDIPVSVRGLVQQIKSFERISSEAAVDGDYNKALLAMVINPLVPGDRIAKTILDEMMEAHKAYLPHFFKKDWEGETN